MAQTRNSSNDIGKMTRITNALMEMLEDYRGDGPVITAINWDSDLDAALSVVLMKRSKFHCLMLPKFGGGWK